MALFESYERRIGQITPVLEQYGMKTLEDAKAVCTEKGIDVYEIVKSTQPIAFENAMWAYTLGAAIAIKVAQRLLMLLLQSEKGYKLSVSQVLLLTIEKLV